MRCSMLIMMSVLAAVAFADANQATANRPTRGKKTRMGLVPGYEKVMAPMDGLYFRIVNAQSEVSDAEINEAARIFCGLFDLPIDYVRGGSLEAAGKDGKAGAVVVIDAEADTPLVAAPDSGWAVIGIKALKVDNPSAEVLTSRVKKELWRASCYALGVGIEATPSVLRPIASPRDLDATEDLCSTPSIAPLLMAGAQKRGIGRIRYVSYRQACREGWAPDPTNDAQRVFFEQMRVDKERGPTNPIKIEATKK